MTKQMALKKLGQMTEEIKELVSEAKALAEENNLPFDLSDVLKAEDAEEKNWNESEEWTPVTAKLYTAKIYEGVPGHVYMRVRADLSAHQIPWARWGRMNVFILDVRDSLRRSLNGLS